MKARKLFSMPDCTSSSMRIPPLGEPFGHLSASLAVSFDKVGDEESERHRLPDDEHLDVSGANVLRAVILADEAAQQDPATLGEVHDRCVEDVPAGILQVRRQFPLRGTPASSRSGPRSSQSPRPHPIPASFRLECFQCYRQYNKKSI